jgi:voltage-gated potassium channel
MLVTFMEPGYDRLGVLGGPRLRAFLLALSVPAVLLAAGTAGYMLVEGWSAFDALYMSAITITTVGYLEVHPLSEVGRMFTVAYLLVGVFSLFYVASAIIRQIVSGEVRRHLGRQIMERALATIEDHVVVCGLGRMGHIVCQEFSAMEMPFVVIDRDPAVVEALNIPHGIGLAGDATSDEVLRRAGVERARTLVTVAASDADNLYIVMSARLLNDKLYIVARAAEEEAEKKLRRAGANRVVSPYVIGGQRVAQAVLRPAVLDFIELATREDYLELQIEEVTLGPRGSLVGAPIKDNRIRQELGVMVVAVRKPSGQMHFNPRPEMLLEAGDVVIALGHKEQLARLTLLARS